MIPKSPVVALLVLLAAATAFGQESTATDQLEVVRGRIGSLERRLSELDAENRSRLEERERLTSELELAEARVREIELVLERNHEEAEEVAGAASELASDLEHHRRLLQGHVEIMALLGRPGHEGLIPAEWVSRAVGGNSLRANFFASFAGAFMYFATLTEVPILQGLIGSGMGKGPALALLLAGPALSLPNMLVIRSVMGTKKTVVFVCLVVVMATISGMVYGTLFA